MSVEIQPPKTDAQQISLLQQELSDLRRIVSHLFSLRLSDENKLTNKLNKCVMKKNENKLVLCNSFTSRVIDDPILIYTVTFDSELETFEPEYLSIPLPKILVYNTMLYTDELLHLQTTLLGDGEDYRIEFKNPTEARSICIIAKNKIELPQAFLKIKTSFLKNYEKAAESDIYSYVNISSVNISPLSYYVFGIIYFGDNTSLFQWKINVKKKNLKTEDRPWHNDPFALIGKNIFLKRDEDNEDDDHIKGSTYEAVVMSYDRFTKLHYLKIEEEGSNITFVKYLDDSHVSLDNSLWFAPINP
jgi:hypothetical protein